MGFEDELQERFFWWFVNGEDQQTRPPQTFYQYFSYELGLLEPCGTNIHNVGGHDYRLTLRGAALACNSEAVGDPETACR